MTYREVMKELKAMGTAQNRKVYKRHGAGENLFGVSFANLDKLQKKDGEVGEIQGRTGREGRVDHGKTACKTLDAVAYIQKARARANKKK